jgi:hypothetical protein
MTRAADALSRGIKCQGASFMRAGQVKGCDGIGAAVQQHRPSIDADHAAGSVGKHDVDWTKVNCLRGSAGLRCKVLLQKHRH